MADFRVTNTNDSGAGSLRQAIINSNATNGEDKIIFDSSLRGSTINLISGEIRITDDLTIEGLGGLEVLEGIDEETVTIDAGGNSRVFRVDERSFVGNSDINFTVDRLIISGGSAQGNGGAIYADDAFSTNVTVTIINSWIKENSATGDGGAVYVNGEGVGGDGRLTIFASLITDNTAGGDGGAISTDSAYISVTGGSFVRNSAGGDGGAIGGIEGSLVSVDVGIFEENIAGNYGGGLSARRIRLNRSNFSNNQAGSEGGGIYSGGVAIITNSNISGNGTSGSGGGVSINTSISNIGEIALIANTTISGNRANVNGGGIKLDGGLRGSQVTPEGNLILSNVTIANNIADNNNDGGGDGGGIHNRAFSRLGSITEIPGQLTLENTILAGNFDTPNNNGSNSIAPDISGSAKGNANNLLGDDQGLTEGLVQSSELLGTGTDIISANPGLGTLQDNGGLTQTIELLPGSPAINRGNNDLILRETFIDVDGDGQPNQLDFDDDLNTNNAQFPYDQRTGEFIRIVGGTVDIGAFELQEGENTEPENPELIVPESVFLQDTSKYLGLLRDFDGNDLGAGDAWKSIGSIDVQGDGNIEYVFVNPVNGRWATVGVDITGVIDFANHGQGGDTRVVGIYIDPLVEAGIVEKNSDVDSQRRFQNDLLIDNLTLIEGSGFNYDGDDFGLQEVYFQVNDGTAVLHAYMHADGNIQYANYQSKSDLEQFMTENGIDSSIWDDWL